MMLEKVTIKFDISVGAAYEFSDAQLDKWKKLCLKYTEEQIYPAQFQRLMLSSRDNGGPIDLSLVFGAVFRIVFSVLLLLL